MAEKVLHEIKIVETDEGFRIEINGDKERIRKMFFGPGMMFAPWMGGGGGRRGGGRGPRKFKKMFYKHGPPPPPHHRHHHHHDDEYHHYDDEYDLGPWWDTDHPEEEKPPQAG